MTTVEIIKDWTWQELQRELLIWQGVELGRSQFFHWLPFAYVKPQVRNVYSNRDRTKLLRFAELMKRYRNLNIASCKLFEELEKS